MILSEVVKVSSRFQRSIRIDSDIGNHEIIESYVCPQSAIEVLVNMANGRVHASEAAFTWTGPYGSGKSSLVVALNALIGKDPNLKKIIEKSCNKNDLKIIQKSFNVSRKNGWDFLPIVGFKGDFQTTLRGQIFNLYKLTAKQKKMETIELVENIADSTDCGLFIIVDEMGKYLEAAAEGACDIYFFQQLAECASRSNGKILLLGVLHQSFAEYSRRLTRNIRDEWLKIQGRFVDLPLNVAGEELIELVGKAIRSPLKPVSVDPICKKVASHISNWRPVSKDTLAYSLTQCWPLHPVTASLLGPVSRRRFGQNQRSIFGFLNSSEPLGFQDFLKNTEVSSNTVFTPDLLWDYLQCNLEPSIMASPDGHRWSIAVDALTRTEAYGADEEIQAIVKSIALMNMFHERSGLVPEEDILLSCIHGITKKRLIESLKQLERWSILLYKKHKKSYSLYEGSDFDIDAAIEEAYDQVPQLDYRRLRKAAGFKPIVAKKHYHTTGALRWMDVDLVPSKQACNRAENYEPANGAMGLFMVLLGDEGEKGLELEKLCKQSSKTQNKWPVICSIAKNSYLIRSHAKELQALEWIKSNNPALGGDSVARREVDSRLAIIRNRLGEYLQQTISSANWFVDGDKPTSHNLHQLNQLASSKADELFSDSPRVKSELVNRTKPSNNSNAALKILLKAMVQNLGSKRLEIKGYPAEGGLYDILIKNTCIYNGRKFVTPKGKKDRCKIAPLWKIADEHFKKHSNRPVSLKELYDLWSAPPYGVKKGILPFIAVAYLLTKINDYAAYLEGVYRPSVDDLFIDVLMKSPVDIALRPMIFSDVGQKILAGVCNTVNNIDTAKPTLSETSEPLEIARRLVSLVLQLPPWVLRTRKLSKNCIQLRELIKNANDPNKVLFDDLPHLFKEYQENLTKGDVQPIIEELQRCLLEMNNAYPILIKELERVLLDELQANFENILEIEEINVRAKNILHISGDFKLDAFAARLVNYTGSLEDIEGIASLAAEKPPRDWIDLDVNRAKLHIAELSQQFNQIEAFGRVHNREDFRQAVAFMVGLNGKPETYVHEFTITKNQHVQVEEIENSIKMAVNSQANGEPELLLAALAKIGAEVIESKRREVTGDKMWLQDE